MKDLAEIGFYTLEDHRAKGASATSPLWRCELLVTAACNFRCPYCRGVPEEDNRTLTWEQARRVLDLWIEGGLRNVRFTGGEPTMWHSIERAVHYCRGRGVGRIAISTNGSAGWDKYEALIDAGVDDFSVSLDACCSSTADAMAGLTVPLDTILENIQRLSRHTYTTVGVVLTPENISEARSTILLAHSLGVADVRVIPAAQWQPGIADQLDLPRLVLDAHPILAYRMNRANNGRSIRGIGDSDTNRCPLVLDDMAVMNGKHFPCVIYMREWGQPIGRVGPNMREERRRWFADHDTHTDSICRGNCLDVCVDYNNRFVALAREMA